jgi:hypothetical protein
MQSSLTILTEPVPQNAAKFVQIPLRRKPEQKAFPPDCD